jgi:uncharacterized protein YigA (DUF484 family)
MSNGNTKSSKPQAVALSAQSVALFLRQNPHFLTEHEDLLTHLELAHECGEATSLIQRQTQVMRQKIEDNAQRMSDILSTARRNDVQFEKTKRLVIELAGTKDLVGLAEVLTQSFTQEFDADAVHLALFSSLPSATSHPNLSSIKLSQDDELSHYVKGLISKNWAYCQAFESKNMAAFFKQKNKLKSTAVMPLFLAEKAIGVLIIASESKDHYNDQLATLFLNHVAAVTSKCLGRIQD